MAVYAERLFQKLEQGALTPHWRRDPAVRDLERWIALHDRDKRMLQKMAGWTDPGRPYKADPLPARISGSFADYLYGEDPIINARQETDQPQLDNIILGNDFNQALWDGVDMQSSEGETYWRIYVDKGAADVPIIDWHSRTMTVPMFRGRNLLACAFISRVNTFDDDNIWWFVEVHEDEEVHNRLYRQVRSGDESEETMPLGIGAEEPLTRAVETEDLRPVWEHGLPMLAGRVPNGLGRDKRVGISDYRGIEDLLLDLNEAHTIDSENFRLAGKKRAVMPERYATESGTIDAGEEIFFTKEGWEEEMESGEAGPFKLLEYSYDGVSSIARKEDLAGTALTRVGLTRVMSDPASADTSGNAPSGAAWAMRLIPTKLAAKGKTRRWDGAVPYILELGMEVDQLAQERGGFGRSYADTTLPSHERGSILPEDDEEKIRRVSLQYTGGLISLESALKELHPRWSDKLLQDEAERIRKEHTLPRIDDHSGDNPGGGGTGPGGGPE